METRTEQPESFLVCRSAARFCALRLGHVVETMRPLPVESLGGAPPFVRGLAMIRGVPLPVVDTRLLLGGEGNSAPGRFVTVWAGPRQVALSFDEVLGVRKIPREAFSGLPPLLAQAAHDAVATLGALDSALLLVLEESRLLGAEA